MDILLANFMRAVARVLGSLLWLYMWIIIIQAVLTWVNPDPRNPIVRFLYAVTEPVLYRIRRRLPFVFAGGIDFSPLVAIFALYFLQVFLVRSLYDLSYRIQ